MYVCALAVMQYFEISYLLNFVNLLPVMQQHFWLLANCNMQLPQLTFSHDLCNSIHKGCFLSLSQFFTTHLYLQPRPQFVHGPAFFCHFLSNFCSTLLAGYEQQKMNKKLFPKLS